MANAPDAELHKGLKQRHLTMIAIGGVIGAGLFVGSGAVINEVGPAAFLTYAVTGVLIVMVMRMLGEMATANPSTGSFADYARKALGGWAGFSVGWLYWYFWVIVVGFEAVAGREAPDPLGRGAAVAPRPRADDPDDRDEPVLGQVVRRVRVLVRGHQGPRDHHLPRARQPLRDRALARARRGLLEPDRARRVPAQRPRRDLLRHRRGHLLDGRRRDRDDRGRRVERPGTGHRQGDELRGPAHRDLLRRLDLPARGDAAVELHRARRLAVRERLRGDGHPRTPPTS